MKLDKKLQVSDLSGQTLLGVEVYGHPDTVGIDTITFNFDRNTASVSVNADDDTLFWVEGTIFPVYQGQVRKQDVFWDRYLKKIVVFAWKMTNQDGYCDAAQLMFGPMEKEFMIAQMMAVSSSITLFSLSKSENAPLQNQHS